MNKNKNEILDKICIAINSNNVSIIFSLVESALDHGYSIEDIKNRVRFCLSRPNFDVICELCRAMRFEENRRINK